MDPIQRMTMRIIKIIPHVPYYLADGNTVVRKWTEPFIDRMGNKATLTKVTVKTKKNKENECVILVNWE